MIKIKKGLDVPIKGAPKQEIGETKKPKQVALLGEDYVGMKPTMEVGVGDNVKLGQLLFTDKKTPGVRYTSPGAGKVASVNRGEKRAFVSIVIQLSGSDEVTFKSHADSQIAGIKKDKIIAQLVESGLWTSLRTRPFSKVANPEKTPHSIFVTAMDSEPLAPAISKVLQGKERHFNNGLKLLSKLTDGTLFLCKAPETKLDLERVDNLKVEEFSGPHPAGLAGTHIHFLDPVSRNKKVWTIGAQDVAAIGELFATGKINVERVVSLAGPSVKNPRLVKTRIGAAVDDVTASELSKGENRIVSGSVLSGHTAAGERAFLGRYHQQISVLPEGNQRDFLGWLNPGFNLYSVKNIVVSKLIPGKKFNFNTSTNGDVRAIVPMGNYEKVMPLDIMPLFLLRSLAVNDLEDCEKLGVLELDEEDLALCTYVCPSKIDYGPMLRKNLTILEKEG